jgi:hypothetical protein
VARKQQEEENKKKKICKIVAYGCQTPSAQRRSDQKIPFIVATYVYASSQGQRTHSARTKIV